MHARVVEEVLGELPEHPLALAVNSVLALAADGYPAAMRPVYRAFQISALDQPHLTSHLAMGLAQVMMAKGHILATRQHLSLAVRFDSQNEEAVEAFLEIVRANSVSMVLECNGAFAFMIFVTRLQ